jgi:hypothetical protein
MIIEQDLLPTFLIGKFCFNEDAAPSEFGIKCITLVYLWRIPYTSTYTRNTFSYMTLVCFRPITELLFVCFNFNIFLHFLFICICIKPMKLMDRKQERRPSVSHSAIHVVLFICLYLFIYICI